MSLWKIAWRSIQQRALASSLTGLSIALGVALVVAVLVAQKVIRDSFTRGASGYHLVVGKKGSQLQLVLNTVYHLQDPIENIPYSYYKRLITPSDPLGRSVKVAIPYCLGDNYEGFRVVGTIPDLFTKLEYADEQKYEFEPGGRNFKANKFFEAVIGSTVARETRMKVGDTFTPVHGLSNSGDGHVHEDKFTVVGILKPTGTANDRALFINIEGFYLLENHAKPLEDVAAAKAEAEAHHHADEEHAHHAHDEPADHDHAAHADQDHATPETAGKHDEANHDHAPHKDADHAHANEKAPAAAAPDEHADHDHAAAESHNHAAHDEAAHDHAAGEPHDHADHDHADHDHADHDHAGHDHAGHSHSHEPLPEDQREVTAVLVLARGPQADLVADSLRRKINKGEEAQAAVPVRVIADFFQKIVQQITIALLALTVLIIVVSGIGVMVSIYNSMNDRRRDIAVMRALGAARGTVLSVILVESILLSLGGGVLGVVLGHGLVAALGPIVERNAGVSLGFFQFDRYELVLIPGLVLLASLVGYLPALSAYRTDVAKALSASP